MSAIVTTLFDLIAPLFLLGATVVCVVAGRRAGQRMDQFSTAGDYAAATKSRHSRRTAYRTAAILAAFLALTLIFKVIG